MSKTIILKCNCPHEFQDKEYGLQKRVHNALKKKESQQQYRCTVCGNVKYGPKLED